MSATEPLIDRPACCRARSERPPIEGIYEGDCTWPDTDCWVNGPGLAEGALCACIGAYLCSEHASGRGRST